VVRFFSHAQKPGALMAELFEKTFGLRLVPESPYTLAARVGLDRREEAAWQELEVVDLGASAGGRAQDLRDAAAEEE
jgi:hypothetical protein